MHVTLRSGRPVRCLRSARVFPAVRHALAAASHARFRILQFTVQDDHLHLIVEADDARALGRGLRGLAIRVARAVNRALNRRGAVWTDRYHARALTSPRAVRNALVYVLMNRRKHREGERGLDPCSSALWFTGWRSPAPPPPAAMPVVRARTWLPPSAGAGTASSGSTNGRVVRAAGAGSRDGGRWTSSSRAAGFVPVASDPVSPMTPWQGKTTAEGRQRGGASTVFFPGAELIHEF